RFTCSRLRAFEVSDTLAIVDSLSSGARRLEAIVITSSYIRNKPVSALGNRFYERVVRAVATKNLSQSGNVLHHRCLFDEGILPNFLEQILLGNQVSTASYQGE